MNKQTINNVEAFIEEGQVYLKLDVTYEDDTTIRKVKLPKIEIPIGDIRINRICDRWRYDGYFQFPTIDIHTVNFGIGDLKLHREKDGLFYCEEVQKKTQEMTLSEIEKKLGHPVKIISEKESKTKKKKVK